ncbi:hypothetical protein PV10_00725 [Exophiala mesophila]|uniref:Methylated-DNA--protein-cysteine methyltransferase n=1 Tax=Exophiala mesophila TaxID=212818 RepID=A0A0D1ZQP4_EXOME|nr:uncharacterized protein PV10_00725 [Exophiala mesophila]KIV96912.1 hypothetical protein PV10_00725 [Exophiala mesophila]
MTELQDLRNEWTKLYSETLPRLAKAKDHAQSKWPVTLDHCFARIILDNTVGRGSQQWDKVIKRPAVKNMSREQLRDAISLGEDIQTGKVDLCQLDEKSLQCRGKNQTKYANKRMLDRGGDDDDSGRKTKMPKSGKRQSTLTFNLDASRPQAPIEPKHPSGDMATLKATLSRIQSHASLTPYRKRLYTALLSVPRGRYTTYAALSDFLDSSARAVGSGMRNNPFAPDVPCHRVLAANGSIGGFGGDWGKDGKHANKKIELLTQEGVRFDVSGKVLGEPFKKFHLFES